MGCAVSRITYEKLGILVTDFPAYKDNGTTSGDLIRVQSFNYGFQHPAIDIKEIGSDSLVLRNGESPILRQPEVTCEINYLFSSGQNEQAIGLYNNSDGSVFKNFFEADSTDDINIVAVGANDRDLRDLNFVEKNGFSGYHVIGFGNCFLKNYSYSAEVGSLPESTISYAGSNLKFDIYNPEEVPSLPSVKLGVNNPFSEERLYLDENSFSESLQEEANAIMPGDMIVEITKKAGEYGGAPLESVHAAIQSVNINLPVDRQDIFGFGSNYVFDRKLKLPIIASADINMIVREYSTGQIESFFREGSRYEILIKHTDRSHQKGTLAEANAIQNIAIDNAQLKSQSFTNQIGGQSNVSSSFSFGVSVSKGLRIYDK